MLSYNIRNRFYAKACPGRTLTSAGRMLMMLIALMLTPLLAEADGLFDFQMKLAEKGNAEAQFKVGEMYETGFGVTKDMDQAREWIVKAANQGHETAGFKLLFWDVEKNGITADNKARVENLKSKAESGNAQAQYYVGKMYARGVGMKKNHDTALDWLNKAALVGVLEAEREAARVREDQQRASLAKQRAEEKRRAELKAKQEAERKAKLEERRRIQAQKDAEAKRRADEIARKNREAAAQTQAQKEAAERQRLLAQQEAELKRKEAEKQALIKKRQEEEKERKAQFESDPCSGKSARFLSTCK
jgi:flagellar biosynthesis GTPase FlhF